MTGCTGCGDALTALDTIGTCPSCDTAQPAPGRPFVFTDTLASVLKSGRPVCVASYRNFPLENTVTTLKLNWGVPVAGCDALLGYIGDEPVACIRVYADSGLWKSSTGKLQADWRDAAADEETHRMYMAARLIAGKAPVLWTGAGDWQLGRCGGFVVAQVMRLMDESGWVPVGLPGDVDRGTLGEAVHLAELHALGVSRLVMAVMT